MELVFLKSVVKIVKNWFNEWGEEKFSVPILLYNGLFFSQE